MTKESEAFELRPLSLEQLFAKVEAAEKLPITDAGNPLGFKRDDENLGWDIWWGGYEYFVADDRLESQEELLDWVVQMGTKNWKDMTAQRLARWVRAVMNHRGWSKDI